MDNSVSYQELKRERDTLQLRIKQLEDEILSLRERLLQYEPLRSDNEKPTPPPAMTRLSLSEKVALFRSLFRGREDVFARRWQNRSNGKSGYQPVCENEWNPQLCNKRQYKCSECPNRQFSRLTDNDIYRHLEGKAPDCRDVIELYVINEDNTCHLLCADFDDKNCEHGYKGDVLTFVNVCKSWNIPYYVERSRSGNGAHVWLFFNGSNFLTRYISSLGSARSSIIIICAKVKFSHRSLVTTRLADLIPKGIKIAVATREKNEHTEHLERHGIRVIINESLSFSATIIDRSRLWYGNVNPLGFYKQDDNIITFRHPEVATTLIDSLSSI